MTDDPIAVLEHELVNAARRRASGRPTGRLRLSLGALATAALMAVTLAVAGGVLVVLGGHHHTTQQHPARPSTAAASRKQLIDILGVLRRPQVPADLHSPAITRFLSGQGSGADVPLIRRAVTTPWGEGVFVIPTKAAASQQRSGEGLDLEVGGLSGGGCCASAAVIQAGHEMLHRGCRP